MLDKEGKFIPTDYVSTGSNHHIAIFIDADGNYQEQVVPFFDAVTRVNLGIPVIDYEYRKEDGWKFLFTMKQNEYFVFPNPMTGFDPNEIDLMDPANYARISPNLFRVQKFSTKDYVFRHHLETSISNKAECLRNIIWKRIQNVNGLKGAVKVRINHIGEIVRVGE
jgi:CRISPR-associated endonuclease Csn1